MKKVFLVSNLLVLIFVCDAYTQSMKHVYADSTLSCEYYTSQGRIDGKYVSYYKNGNKKAEGNLRNNYRYGKWTLWDKSGNKSVERDYQDPFSYKQVYPVKSDIDTSYDLKYNTNGYIDYFLLQEKMVVLSKRVWRYIPVENNTLIFENNILQNIISANVVNGNLTAYSSEDDDFLKPLNPEEIKTTGLNIIGYKIKEDWFFDNVRMVSESRIIGICPVAFDTVKRCKINLYWIYFPAVRKYFAGAVLEGNDLPEGITNCDDLFFFRNFSSYIYKESNVYDREISDYKFGEDIYKEAEKIEISIIEMEHDLWMSFAK
jgi:gliding motility associated protien GldN